MIISNSSYHYGNMQITNRSCQSYVKHLSIIHWIVLLQAQETWSQFLYHLFENQQSMIMFVVVNFDALAQASDFLIQRRQVVFLSWMQDSKLGSLRHQFTNRLNAHSQTHWAIKDQAKNLNSTAHPNDMMSEHPAHLTSLRQQAIICYLYQICHCPLIQIYAPLWPN